MNPPAGAAVKHPPISEYSAGPHMARNSGASLLEDLAASFWAPGFWIYGAWMDTVLRYRTQLLGPFWMIAGPLIIVLVLGNLYAGILGTQDHRYLAHLAIGIVIWSFVQQSLQGSARVFWQNRRMIQTGYVRYTDYILRLIFKNIIVLGHNLLVVVGVIVFTGVYVTPTALILFITVPLVLSMVLGVCCLFAVIGARYADLADLLQSILRIAVFVTPIIWVPHMVGKAALIGPFLYLNPFYYLIEVLRTPLVYGTVPWLEISVLAAAMPLIWIPTILTFARAKLYIPLWV